MQCRFRSVLLKHYTNSHMAIVTNLIKTSHSSHAFIGEELETISNFC